MESQKGNKKEKMGGKANRSNKKGKQKENNVKTLETQPLYEFFKFKIHSNKQFRRT